jgi:dienelactone hydrolase
MNSDRKNVYDEASAKLAWERMTAFFRKHLA